MDKVREEFEKDFGEQLSFDRCFGDSTGGYIDLETRSAWEGWQRAHALYTKETEPLKWRWENIERDVVCFIGVFDVARFFPTASGRYYIGLGALTRDIVFEAENNVVDSPEIAQQLIESWATAFLAKLRGEA